MPRQTRRQFIGSAIRSSAALYTNALCAHALLTGVARGDSPTTNGVTNPTSSPTIHRPRQFFGVNIDAPYRPEDRSDYPNLIRALTDANIGSVRTSIGWRYAEATKGKFDWSGMDKFLTKLPGDIDVLVLLLGTPAWSSGVDPAKTVGWFDTYMPRDFADWGNFVHQAVKRYCKRIKYWEMWNEENGIDFFRPMPDATAYVKLLKSGYEAAKRADPNCTVLLGGLQMNGVIANPGSPVKTPNFLEDIYKAGGGPFFDICNTHPYVGKVGGAKYLMDLTRDTRKVMSRYGDANKPLWITETGWPIDAGNSEADQAKLLADTYIAAGAPDSGIDRVFWFTFRDFPSDVLGGEGSMGIIHRDWKRKQAYESLKILQQTPSP